VREVRIDFNVDDTLLSLSALLRRVLGESQPSSEHDIVVNLSQCDFVGPSAVVTLCGLRRLLEVQGTRLALVLK